MTTNQMTTPEREALLMVNSYGVEVAIKVNRNQMKFYQMNAVETERLIRIENELIGIQNKNIVAR
jgi:hypothetical protein